MKFRIVYKAWWMRWAQGMVVWPFMFFRGEKDTVPQTLYRHELQHCYQVQRLGIIRFYATYIWLWLRKGYRNHPYEIEAWQKQNEPLSKEEAAWFHRDKIELQ